ncbi:MAG: hypothetical protein NZM38_08055 [Cytophagales bacterium]|nr:hypothetical protein [Cytophagales bacterium]MDW8384711.1 hypothetical protein [Flammeovirgaceae bacterium]
MNSEIEIHTQLQEYIYAIAWSDDNTKIAVALSSGEIAVISIDSRELVRFQAHDECCTSVCWINESQSLASAGQDGMLRIWSAQNLLLQREIIGDGKSGFTWIDKLVHSSVSKRLAAIVGKQVLVWNTLNLENILNYTLPKSAFDIAFSNDGNTVVAVYYGGALLAQLAPAFQIQTLPYPASFISCALSPNQKYLAAGTGDNKIHFWLLPYVPEQDLEMSGYYAKVRSLSWSANSKYLATPSYDSLIIWDVYTTGTPQNTRPTILQEHYGKITQVAFHPNGNYLASADEAGYVIIWNFPLSKKVIKSFQLPKGEITALQWANRINKLSVGNEKGNLIVWNIDN